MKDIDFDLQISDQSDHDVVLAGIDESLEIIARRKELDDLEENSDDGIKWMK